MYFVIYTTKKIDTCNYNLFFDYYEAHDFYHSKIDLFRKMKIESSMYIIKLREIDDENIKMVVKLGFARMAVLSYDEAKNIETDTSDMNNQIFVGRIIKQYHIKNL